MITMLIEELFSLQAMPPSPWQTPPHSLSASFELLLAIPIAIILVLIIIRFWSHDNLS